MTQSATGLRRTVLLVPGVAVVLQACASIGSSGALAPSTATDAYLERLVGEWDIERSIRGRTVGNALTVEPVLGGSFIRLHMVSTSPTDPYEAIALVGMDAERGEYVAHWCDSFGPGYSALGRGKRKGQSLELRFEYEGGPFFNTWEFDPVADRWTFVGESGSTGGMRTPFARDVVTRKKR